MTDILEGKERGSQSFCFQKAKASTLASTSVLQNLYFAENWLTCVSDVDLSRTSRSLQHTDSNTFSWTED